MKKFFVVLLITGLLMSGIFVFGGDGHITGSTDGVEHWTVVSGVEEVW
ncbi:hypothetical protein X928_01495 [Petrotoga miotherma DSM 10691]|uniref:Uncharacterized protein n=1 Tax=Petrotoga miotherma DSM 10691 TaxID=1434326 RepID=A0A2K1PGU7_9BACT|nr:MULTISPECIES: hypothetical protein [Petrotoga]MDN5346352.1 hypothetical protein [Petrotoga sp.]PNS02031.1 hypothetical protein X928_01495 [Petrotoga miotherma DSM 10691]